MTVTARLPMGIEDFGRIREENFYYVDKTSLIQDLIENIAYVNLFTRPRRFGKTLNISMLKYFFEIGADRTLFDGLIIAENKELCEEYMGRFPVISISLKDMSGVDFQEAKRRLRVILGTEASKFYFLSESDRLTEMERCQYRALVHLDELGLYTMPDELIQESLYILSHLLRKHYDQKTIILIDEYDVPLDKAYQAGYYDDMANFIRVMFGRGLKSNDNMYFAVLTGCLRVSKESIFTGLNNFNVFTVKDVRYNEYFGFTDSEVRKMLGFYGFMEQYDAVKDWYDGYHFGRLDIYCPWDVINHCGALRGGTVKEPQNYWINTSSNDIIRKFIGRAKSATRNEIELLIEGGTVRKEICQELTYRDLDSKIENLWSILFTTGYLTQIGQEENGVTELAIPNKEIRWIFVKQIREWFDEEAAKDSQKLERFCRAFLENNTAAIEEGFTSYLRKTISIRDSSVRKDMKENFYHGILLGLFAHMEGWSVSSNAEAGDGYSDISIVVEEEEIGIVIELKYAENAAFDAACTEAMRQIRDKKYEEALLDDGMKTIYKYGIACYKKRCRVLSCVHAEDEKIKDPKILGQIQ